MYKIYTIASNIAESDVLFHHWWQPVSSVDVASLAS